MRTLRNPWHTLAALLLTLLTLALGGLHWSRLSATQTAAEQLAVSFRASGLPLAEFVEQRSPQFTSESLLIQVIAADGAVLFSPATHGGPPLPVSPDDLLRTLNGREWSQRVLLSTGPALLLLRPLDAGGVPVGLLAVAAPIPRWSAQAWPPGLLCAALWLTLLWRRMRPSAVKLTA